MIISTLTLLSLPTAITTSSCSGTLALHQYAGDARLPPQSSETPASASLLYLDRDEEVEEAAAKARAEVAAKGPGEAEGVGAAVGQRVADLLSAMGAGAAAKADGGGFGNGGDEGEQGVSRNGAPRRAPLLPFKSTPLLPFKSKQRRPFMLSRAASTTAPKVDRDDVGGATVDAKEEAVAAQLLPSSPLPPSSDEVGDKGEDGSVFAALSNPNSAALAALAATAATCGTAHKRMAGKLLFGRQRSRPATAPGAASSDSVPVAGDPAAAAVAAAMRRAELGPNPYLVMLRVNQGKLSPLDGVGRHRCSCEVIPASPPHCSEPILHIAHTFGCLAGPPGTIAPSRSCASRRSAATWK